MNTGIDAATDTAFRDMVSGCVFQVSTPWERPDLWDRFLQGALATYRHFGVESALEYPGVRDDGTTSRFIVGMDTFGGLWGDVGGTAVAGVRVLGPYRDLSEVHALRAWAGRPGEREFRRVLAERLAEGVVEVKTGWVDRVRPGRGLGEAVARCLVHAAGLQSVRYSVLTASAHAITRFVDVGAVVDDAVDSVPYPDQRYRTVPLWLDTHTYQHRASARQAALIADEQDQLGWSVGATGRGDV
ncbi:MAG: hypothetical protein HOV83_40810 [Catenulispora sp.]|nr:hypothetical protein [Catenulispora sp.]